jgi:polyhydroxyalkanoate synthesis regulator phasin
MPAPRSKSSARSGASGSRKQAAQARSAAQTANLGEQLANRILKPLDLVVLSREKIQQTLDEAAERGRVTRADANELVLELIERGRQQTDDLMKELLRGADRARRTIGVGPSFPIRGYDELTARQVDQQLAGLKPADLRKVREYERQHANRKTVLDAIERALT